MPPTTKGLSASTSSPLPSATSERCNCFPGPADEVGRPVAVIPAALVAAHDGAQRRLGFRQLVVQGDDLVAAAALEGAGAVVLVGQEMLQGTEQKGA